MQTTVLCSEYIETLPFFNNAVINVCVGPKTIIGYG